MVPTGAPKLREFAVYGSHKAGDDFLVVPKDLEAQIRIVYRFQ